MVTSCETVLVDPIQAAQFIQSATTQCLSLAEHLPAVENHIAHATAVFCELGLAVSAAVIFDPLKWQERNAQADEDVISRQDLLAYMKNESVAVRAVMSVLKSPKWTWAKFTILPLISLLLAVTSLLSMAGFLHLSEQRSFCYAIASFAISGVLPILARRSQARYIVQRTLKAEIPL